MDNKDLDKLQDQVKTNNSILKELQEGLDAMKREVEKIHHAVLNEHVSHGKRWASRQG